MYKIEEKVSKK